LIKEDTQSKLPDTPEKSDFKEYLLSEYSNIAQAHFKTIDTISTFFRNYLVIVSIPISLIAVLVSIFSGSETIETILSIRIPLSVILLAVSLAGVGVLLYMANLRMDAILYARTINGIRKYFYDRTALDINIGLRTRVLPQSPYHPAYHEKMYFWPVVLSIAVFNTLYLFFALAGFSFEGEANQIDNMLSNIPLWVWPVNFAFLAGHFGLYYRYARHRERAYLRSYIIGIDVDGVLTRHREQFCKLLKKNVGKEIRPDEITAIPVHECESLNISEDDEKAVFNDPEYWTSMPVEEGASNNLEKLRNIFKFKIFIFTYRPWPNTKKMKEKPKKQVNKKWKKAPLPSLQNGAQRRAIGSRLAMKTASLIHGKPIDRVTRLWLAKHELKYDRLIIEKGNEDVPDPRGHTRNRFFKSREYKIKYFVEDDLEKAIKLAYICDIVFLLDQPYNQPRNEVPSNIIRVKSWDEIYKQIRKLS